MRRILPCSVAGPVSVALMALMGLTVTGTGNHAMARSQRLRIDVGGADFRPYPVAATKFVMVKGNSSAKNNRRLLGELSNTLQTGVGLARSLELVPPKSYLAADKEPWNRPKFSNWVNVGASGLIRSAIAMEPSGSIKLSFRFFDVIAQKELLFRSYAAETKSASRTIGRFLDELIELLTGEPGIFSSRIAYVRKTKNGKAVYTSDIYGGEVRRITDADALSLLPAWGGKGKTLMFTSYLKGNPDLYRYHLSTQELEWLSNKRGLNTGASVSPNGQKIALTLSIDGNTEIYVMDWNGKNLTRLTNSWGQDVSPTWSPDGKRIAFVSSRSGQPHLYVMNSDGTNKVRLTFQGTYNQEPNWSPRADGQIAFTARDEFLKYDIFLVHPDQGSITRLTQDEGNNASPSFSPDGHHILFTSSRPPQRGTKLYVMDVDGSNQRRVAKGSGFETPAWGPRRPYK